MLSQPQAVANVIVDAAKNALKTAAGTVVRSALESAIA
jgi:hypothetical protein